jgi:hypothetical protein
MKIFSCIINSIKIKIKYAVFIKIKKILVMIHGRANCKHFLNTKDGHVLY